MKYVDSCPCLQSTKRLNIKQIWQSQNANKSERYLIREKENMIRKYRIIALYFYRIKSKKCP